MPRYRVIPTFRETLVFAVGMAGLMIAQISIARAWPLIPRNLWLDEVLTYQIVADPKLSHGMIALATGGDTNPPTMFLLQRWFAKGAGGASNSTLHAFSLVATWLALVGLYASLRLAVGRWPSVAGTLLMWAHPLVVRHAFEARFYGPLLAATVWTYFLLHLRQSEWWGRSLTRFMLAVSSMLLCTMHYFGVFALVIIVAFYMWLDPQPLWLRIRNAWPTVFGVAALLCCAPLLLSQRNSQTVDTWIDPPSWSQFGKFVDELFPWQPIAIVVGAWVFGLVWIAISAEPPDIRPRWSRAARVLAGLLGLGALPVLIIVFSFVLQPAMMSRYALQVAAALGAGAALLLMRTPRPIAIAACVALAIVNLAPLQAHQKRWAGPKGFDENLARLVHDLTERTDNRPLVFEMRQNLYPVWHAAPALMLRSSYWDFEPTPGRADLTNFRIYERDQARRVRRLYGGPTMMNENRFGQLGKFYIITGDTRDEARLQQLLAGFTVRRVTNTIYEIVPR